MPYTIGSFNIQKFNYRSDKDIHKDYIKIAEIINKEKFDIVALQEILSESALKNQLMPALGKNEWDYRWSAPAEYSKNSAEGYAFIWKKNILKLVEGGYNPRIYGAYGINGRHPLGEGGLIRPPYVGRFTPQDIQGGTSFEIRLINTHIIFSKPNSVDAPMSDLKLRRRELQTLAEEIYRRVSAKRYGNNMPAYTILLGDYNLCLSGTDSKMSSDVINIDEKRKLITVQGEKTTLKRPLNKITDDEESDAEKEYKEGELDFYSHDYDHFSYEDGLVGKLGLRVSRVDALRDYYNNDLEEYRTKVSDHVPIKLVLDLKPKEWKRNHGTEL